MTKQTINLIGAVAVGAIVVVGLLFGVLPRWSAARSAELDRQTVQMHNQDQRLAITALAAQATKLPELQAGVEDLKQQIPTGPHLEQLIQLTATLPKGAVLRSIAPGRSDVAGTGPSDMPTPQTDAASGFTALPVTLVIDVRQPADAATVLDRLRAGPRLLAIDTAEVVADDGGPTKAGNATLTVTGRIFTTQQAGARPTAPDPEPTAGTSP